MISVIAHGTGSNDVWYVDLGASNHIMCHHTWFSEMKEPSKPGYMEIGDDTMHPIVSMWEMSPWLWMMEGISTWIIYYMY